MHISYVILGRNSKFCVWMHLGMAECRVPFLGHCDLDLWPSFQNNGVWSISLTLFVVGIPNSVCGCILRCRSPMVHPWVIVTLSSDLVSRIRIKSDAYPIFYVVGIPNLVCGFVLGWWSGCIPFLGHFDCDVDFWPHFKVFRVYKYTTNTF